MDQLNRELISDKGLTGKIVQNADQLSEKIVQFGEGNFLRGFIDWMVDEMNRKGLFNGRIVAIQPTPHGKVVPKINEQDGLYTVVLRGVMDGQITKKTQIVSSLSRGINPYENWRDVLKVAEDRNIGIVFSNTTEAGLTYQKEGYIPNRSPLSFPGKLTAFLYHRYQNKGPGVIIIPCELLEDNGDLLREIVLKICDDWELPSHFKKWVQHENQFCNTLVDRIVTGFPAEDITQFNKELGYEDQLLTVGEPFHLFAIDGDSNVQEKIPFRKAGLNVHWSQVATLRTIKTRILNGAHTMMFAAGTLAGKSTVYNVMEEDKELGRYIRQAIKNDILPTLNVDDYEKRSFFEATIERFLNPYNHHKLSDIGLNSIFKFKSRLLPTLIGYYDQFGKLPRFIVFSLAALIVLYRPERTEGNVLIGRRLNEEYMIRDDEKNILFFDWVWQQHEPLADVLEKILFEQKLWGMDLNKVKGLRENLLDDVLEIQNQGITLAIEHSFREGI